MPFPIVVTRTIVLDAPAGHVWRAVKTPAAFRHVTRGLIRLTGIRQRTASWQAGESVRGVLLLFGVVPVSVHRLTVERIDDERRELQSDEHGGLLRRWRHLIRVTPIDATHCRYEDQVEIDAGFATPLVAAFARHFYAIRQRRWQALARSMSPGDA